MNCPDCNSELKTVDFLSPKKNLRLIINACPNCHGYWLDNLAVDNLTLKDIKNFKPTANTACLPEKINQLCPECQIALQKMQAESIPHDVTILYCQKCHGKWFPAGEFIKFKQAQESKLNYFKTWHIPLKSIYAILLPIVIILPLAAYFLKYKVQQPTIFLQKPQEQEEQIITQSPQVTFFKTNEVKISFTTKVPTISTLEYGLSKDNLYSLTLNSQPSLSHQFILSNLLSGKTYWYRFSLQLNEKNLITSFYSFITQ